ncbi:hypothetical protein [Streptomyces sp. NRRL F-5053]|uniref:hypothetical protein n=1 Tax=Streptomyces sp. NRRL F-5053 TaxID=1463854 RepID=UPI0004C7C351|nr:hypothetical protein [Streptomyces sp. NRRL F-5053]
MGIKDRALAFGKKFKLDSHHAIERFGVFFSVFAVAGVIAVGGTAISAYRAGSDTLSHTALYTEEFTTSKTDLKGDVDGVYTNEAGDRALVMMHFPANTSISYNARDYRAFLLGSDSDLNSETVETGGIQGSFHVFGSTGYIGVLLDADEPFGKQVLNLTVRANKELSHDGTRPHGDGADELAGDASFKKYDQWRVFFNPGATGTTQIKALDAVSFDPGRAYYDVVLRNEEKEIRAKLDQKLVTMRANLAQIQAYTSDLETTKVDGLFLRPPAVPAEIDGDQVTGASASEAKDGKSTLALKSEHVVPGGFDLDWRAGDVYDGYLDALVPTGKSYVKFLSSKRDEESDSTSEQISNLPWLLSDGTDLKNDYQSPDVSMRPLVTVMNNLSQAYQDYAKNKSQYQSDLLLELLGLDAKLRDVQANGSINEDANFLTTLY